MPRRRPASYTTFAVFNFIVGGFSLLCGMVGFVRFTVNVNNQDVTPQFEAFMAREAPSYQTYRRVSAAANLALGFGFIAGGVTLLSAPRVGRVFAIVCGILSLLHQIGVVVLQLVVVAPAFSRFFNLPGMAFGGLGDVMVFFTIAWAILIGIYDVVMVTVLSLRSVPATFDRGDDYDERAYPQRRRYADEDDERPIARGPGYGDDASAERPRRRRPDPEHDDDDPPPRRRSVDDDEDESEQSRRRGT